MKITLSDTEAGSVARKLLPAIPALIFFLSVLCVSGERAGLYDKLFGSVMMIASTMYVLSFLVARVTAALYKLDLSRRQSEAEIISMNALLETRVKERTFELEQTLAKVQQLSGLLPICSYCKKIRDDKDYWHTVEHYVSAHSAAHFSHGICPACIPRARAELGLKPLPDTARPA